MKKIIFTLCLFLSGMAYADEWVEVASANSKTYSVKPSTVKITNNDGGVKVIMAVGRIVNTDTKKIEASIWYVPLSHCAMQRGNMGITDVMGNFQTEVPFVFGLGTTGSQIAETLCVVANNIGNPEKPKTNV